MIALEPESQRARTRVLRQQAGEIRWELWLRAPLPGLKGMIAGLWAGDSDASYARHRQLPNGELWMMFNLGPPQRVLREGAVSGEVCPEAFVAGLQEAPLAFESIIRHPRVVCVRFLPLGAFAFFGGLPLTDIANQVLDLDSVLGSVAGVEALRERLLESEDLGAALDLVEGWIAARLLCGPSAHPMTRAALACLTASVAEVRVEGLARELGMSSRHLNGLFHREVGVSPKKLARILRFERALEQLATSGSPDLAEIAQDCGYYDQSHLNRDFRELAGMTPTECLARLFHAPGWREVRG